MFLIKLLQFLQTVSNTTINVTKYTEEIRRKGDMVGTFIAYYSGNGRQQLLKKYAAKVLYYTMFFTNS